MRNSWERTGSRTPFGLLAERPRRSCRLAVGYFERLYLQRVPSPNPSPCNRYRPSFRPERIRLVGMPADRREARRRERPVAGESIRGAGIPSSRREADDSLRVRVPSMVAEQQKGFYLVLARRATAKILRLESSVPLFSSRCADSRVFSGVLLLPLVYSSLPPSLLVCSSVVSLRLLVRKQSALV